MKPKHDTLILESSNYSARALAFYRSLGNLYFFPEPGKKYDKKIFEKITILVVRLGYQIDKKWMDKMPNLQYIVTPTTGLNHIDMEAADKRGIGVFSLRDCRGLDKVPSTAELTIGLILALLRRIPWAHQDVLAGNWDRNRWRGHQLQGKILGILGFGRLGRMVAHYARAFGMKVIAADPYVSQRAMAREGVKKVDQWYLFKNSDVASIHVLLDKNTQRLVKRDHLKSMKPTAVMINTARGGIVEEKALLKALEKKWIAGAALDVLWDESSSGTHLKRNPLINYAKRNSNLLVSPHIGGATFEAMRMTEDMMADLLKKKIKV